jgi:hypothetical protein
VAEPERPHTIQRRLWSGREGLRVAVGDLLDVYERQIFEIAALLGVEELLCTAHDSSL